MVETVAPTRSRRLPFWGILVAMVACVFSGVFVLLWIKLPTWAPEWVVRNSPWVDPIVRVGIEHRSQEYEVIEALHARGPSVIQTMSRYLERGDPAVREFSAMVLRLIDDDAAVDALLPYIQDGDSAVVIQVLAMLEQEERHIVLQERKAVLLPVLISYLAHEKASIRASVVKLLGILKDPAATDPLLTLLRGWDPTIEEHKEWFRETITALGEIADDRAIQPLLSLLRRSPKEEDFEQGLRAHVQLGPIFSALSKLSPGPIADAILPLSQDYDTGVVDFEIASRTRDVRVIVALEEVLRQPEPHVRTDWDRLFAGGRGVMGAYALAKLDHPEAKRLLLAAMKDPQVLIRKRAVLGIASTFGHMVDSSLLLAVQEAVSDPSDEVKLAVAYAYRFLSKHLNPQVVEDPFLAMTAASNPSLRSAAIHALASSGISERSITRFIECTKDGERGVRRSAWDALRKVKHPHVMRMAAEAYSSEEPSQRRWFIDWLISSNIGSVQYRHDLVKQAACDSDPRVMEAFAQAKAQMGLTDVDIMGMEIDPR